MTIVIKVTKHERLRFIFFTSLFLNDTLCVAGRLADYPLFPLFFFLLSQKLEIRRCLAQCSVAQISIDGTPIWAAANMGTPKNRIWAIWAPILPIWADMGKKGAHIRPYPAHILHILMRPYREKAPIFWIWAPIFWIWAPISKIWAPVVALIMGKNGEKMDFGYGKRSLKRLAGEARKPRFVAFPGQSRLVVGYIRKNGQNFSDLNFRKI